MTDLSAKVESGAFTSLLNYNSLIMGSKTLANVTVGNFVVTDYNVDISSSSHKTAKKVLSAGGIAGIVIAVVVVVGIAIAAIYFFFGRGNKAITPLPSGPSSAAVVPGPR